MQSFSFAFRAMGSPCELRLYGSSREALAPLVALATDEVTRLERKYSRYRDDSVTSEINRSAGKRCGVVVDAETAALIDYADIAHRQSDGLFDITSGVLREAWDFKSGRLPSEIQVQRALARVGWGKVNWDRPRLQLSEPGMELDFGGYVKEYAADRVAALCRAEGARSGIVDLGGDLCAIGPHPDGRPWQVGVRHPRRNGEVMARLPLAYGAIASSGDYERFMLVDGVRYAHILDPLTGWPVSGLACVSVWAPHCLVAGTSSTIAMLKGAKEGPRWLDNLGLASVRMDSFGRLSGSVHAGGDSLEESACSI